MNHDAITALMAATPAVEVTMQHLEDLAHLCIRSTPDTGHGHQWPEAVNTGSAALRLTFTVHVGGWNLSCGVVQNDTPHLMAMPSGDQCGELCRAALTGLVELVEVTSALRPELAPIIDSLTDAGACLVFNAKICGNLANLTGYILPGNDWAQRVQVLEAGCARRNAPASTWH